MSSTDLTIRLAVGKPEGPNSATLRVWSPKGKSDVYASMRERAGDFKVSLHESGMCTAGLTDQFAKKEVDALNELGGKRHQSIWMRTQHSGLRVVTPLQFAFPSSELRTWRDPLQDKAIIWLNPPQHEHTIIVSLIFSGPDLVDDKWPGRNNGTQLIGTKLLPNGEKFWLLWQDRPTSTIEQSLLIEARKVKNERKPVRFSGITDETPPAPRSAIFIFIEFAQDQLLIVLDAATDTLET